MPLHKAESIHLKTPLGTSEVQLLLGDITELPQDEGVDIIMASVFQGDYSVANAGTLISALNRRLGVNVGELALDKDLDMRINFHCWVSKPLPKHIAFRRLVCFERGRNSQSGSTAQQISVLFRAMTPIFNNEDTTVITPLLATGNQGQSRVSVLRAMVDGACHWIKAGLPLRCLKLVLYSLNPYKLSKRDQEGVDLFKQLKQIWESPNLKQREEAQRNDVFISHSNNDNHWADMIYKQLQEIHPTLRILKKHIEFSTDQVWQKDVFHVMMQSKRIIVILSPSYVQDPECLEQFNMALCVNRLSAKLQICPMYVETVPSMPSYMQLIQYVECRERKEGEVSQVLIKDACMNLLSQQTESGPEASGEPGDAPVTDVMYDVFISYAHRNPKPAETLLKYLQEADSSLSVFFDRSELTTGSLWQQTLYNSMDNTRCVVALLSPAYIQSDVCQEEYNIALNRALAGREVSLIPVCIESMDSLPQAFSYVPVLDAYSGDQNGVLKQVTEDIVQLVRSDVAGQSIVKPSLLIQPSQVQEDRRKQEFDEYFLRDDKTIVYKPGIQQTEPKPEAKTKSKDKRDCDVVFSFSHDSLRLAFILADMINQESPDTQCKFISENNKERLNLLDQSRLVVVLVSDGYVQSSQLLEELHLSLCRQRREKSSPMVYLIQAMHINMDPFYLHLIDYKVGITDKLWTSLVKDTMKSDKGKLKRLQQNASFADQVFTITRNGIRGGYTCSLPERLALSKAALEIMEILENRSRLTVGTNIVNVGNLHTAKNDTAKTLPLQQCLKISKVDEIPTKEATSRDSNLKTGEVTVEKTVKVQTVDINGKESSTQQPAVVENIPVAGNEVNAKKVQQGEISVRKKSNTQQTLTAENTLVGGTGGETTGDKDAAHLGDKTNEQDSNSDSFSNHEMYNYHLQDFHFVGNRRQMKSSFCSIL